MCAWEREMGLKQDPNPTPLNHNHRFRLSMSRKYPQSHWPITQKYPKTRTTTFIILLVINIWTKLKNKKWSFTQLNLSFRDHNILQPPKFLFYLYLLNSTIMVALTSVTPQYFHSSSSYSLHPSFHPTTISTNESIANITSSITIKPLRFSRTRLPSSCLTIYNTATKPAKSPGTFRENIQYNSCSFDTVSHKKVCFSFSSG